MLNVDWTKTKIAWISVVSLGIIIGGLVGWKSLVVAQGSHTGFDCDYNPVGTGSWGPANSLADFRDVDLIAKVKVTGHRVREDEYLTSVDQRAATDRLLLNELIILNVIKGSTATGEAIVASSGGGICLPNETDLYLFLSGPADSGVPSADGFVDDPLVRQPPPVYYIVHPFLQFPIKDGKVSVYEGFRTDGLPSQFHGVTEEELEAALREAVQ